MDDRTDATPRKGEAAGNGSGESRLLRAALEVSRQVDPGECARVIVSEGCSLVGGSGGFVYLRPPDSSEHLLLGCHVPTDDPRRKGLLRLPLEGALSEAGFRNIDRESGECPPLFRPFDFATLISLLGEEPDCRCRLLVGLPTRPEPPILKQTLATIERFLKECLPSLANALRMERVRELVIKDDQTDSYNRRHLDSFLVEEAERTRRYGTVLSLIFLDLDNLKEVNSLYGHAAGSRALRELAHRVIAGIRGSDKLFRYGGDEFCVVLPETDAVGAYELAERLRHTVASRPFEVEPGREASLTASFGLACFPLHADSVAGLLAAADQAMSRVKLSGKNSIGVGTGPPGAREAGLD